MARGRGNACEGITKAQVILVALISHFISVEATLTKPLGAAVVLLATLGFVGRTLSIPSGFDGVEARLMERAEGDTVYTRTVTDIGLAVETVGESTLPSARIGYRTATESSVSGFDPSTFVPDVAVRRGVNADETPDASIIEAPEVGHLVTEEPPDAATISP